MYDLNRLISEKTNQTTRQQHWTITTEQLLVEESLENHLVSWIATIKLIDVATFTSEQQSKQAAIEDTMRQAFVYLKQMSALLTKFKTLYTITHCPLAIITELIPNFKSLISVKLAKTGK